VSTRIHADGIERCSWVTDDQIYIDYHDKEWGTQTKDQRALFEGICLEGFQAGLSWLTILKRREGFRDAFDNFEVQAVAHYGEQKIRELLADERIIRNRAKVVSAINNARVVIEKDVDLTQLMWAHAPKTTITSVKNFAWKATSKESEALSKTLKGLGFSFVGPTTMYALMQSTGMIQDHAPGCFRRS